MVEYKYYAIEYKQVESGIPVLLFSAPCHQVTEWAGIPRKEEKLGVQTVGFQRGTNKTRVNKLKQFLDEEKNIFANPILCAIRDNSQIKFEPLEIDENGAIFGRLTISSPDYSNFKLKALLEEVETLLIQRLPRLEEVEISTDEIAAFCRDSSDLQELDEDEDLSIDSEQQPDDEIGNSDDESEDLDEKEQAVAFSSESHIEDFFRAIRLRRLALETTRANDLPKIGGFSKEMLREYLRSATVVDGQHRLLGAQRQLDKLLDTEPIRAWQDERLEQGTPVDEVLKETKLKFARKLGIALIQSDDWAEHVFQFVVVNQKSAKVPTALLGSIIATTLTDSEVSRITDRLSRADIKVMDYRTIAFLEGSSSSPFFGLIKRGYDEPQDLEKRLDSTVIDRLVKIFKDLKGAKHFHDIAAIDHALGWRKKGLERSGLVADYAERGYTNPYKYWSAPDGPWRIVFCAVFNEVRKNLASNLDDPNLGNVWGYPKESNLFNSVYLSILATDFFDYINSGPGIPINSPSEAISIANAWLDGAKPDYFARDWGIKRKGLKKTDGPIKKLWSSLWVKYRNNGYLKIGKEEDFIP